MATVVFLIGTTNLMLGYALAVCLRRWIDAGAFRLLTRRPRDVEPEGPLAAHDALREQIPAEWQGKLQAVASEPRSFVEAAVQVLQLEIRTYLKSLRDLEAEFRPAMAQRHDAVPALIVSQLTAINRQWLDAQQAANRHLSHHAATLGQFAEIGADLSRVLAEQQPQIEAIGRRVEAIDAAQVDSAYEQIDRELTQLFALANSLQDKLAEALVATMCAR